MPLSYGSKRIFLRLNHESTAADCCPVPLGRSPMKNAQNSQGIAARLRIGNQVTAMQEFEPPTVPQHPMAAQTLPDGFPALADPYEDSQRAGIQHLEQIVGEQAATAPVARPQPETERLAQEPHARHRHASRSSILQRHGSRLASFSIIGAAVFLLGLAVQWALVHVHAGSYGSYAGQAVISIQASWLLNRRFTWGDRAVSAGTSLLKWNVQRWTATIPNLALYALLVHFGTGWLIANVATTAIFTAVNYVMGDRWSFATAAYTRRLPPVVPHDIPPLPPGPLPSVSVVIPVKGSERTIHASVMSLLDQDYPAPVEVILVGDVGDSTWTALTGLADPRLVVLEQEKTAGRRDPNVKRHKGLMAARGDLLALADSDIVMDRDWLAKGVALLLDQGGGAVAGGMRAIQPHEYWPRFVDRNMLAAKTSRIPIPYRVTAEDFGKRKAPLTANVIFTRDLYEQTPLDPEWSHGYEDYEWMWRVVKDGHNVLMHDALTGAHHHREKFSQLVREYRRSAHGCAQFVRRHPDSPLAEKRKAQAILLPLAALAAVAAAGVGVGLGYPFAVAGFVAVALLALGVREVIRSRSIEAASYPAAGLTLGGVFAASLVGNLLRPAGARTSSAWDTGTQSTRKSEWKRFTFWPLAIILAIQSGLSLGLVWSNTVFADEALYLWAGHLEIAHWLHGYPLPVNQKSFSAYFSGAPQIYPPIGAAADALGGIAGARILSLVFMLAATILLYLTTKRILGKQTALAASALWAVSEPCIRLAFATYDPMTVMLLAFAAWLAVESGFRKRRGEMMVLAALALAVGCVVTYSYALYLPVIAVFVWLALSGPLGDKRAAISAAWLGGASVALFVGLLSLLHDWGGFLSEILTRSGGTSGVESVTRSAWEWGGIIFALAVVGSIMAATSGKRRIALVLAVATISAVFVPLNQARIETGTSLDKHMAVGLWLAAIAAGYAVVTLTRLPARRLSAVTMALAALAVPAISGWEQAYATYHIWPSTASFTPAFEAAIKTDPGTVLVEHPAMGLRNVAEYSTPLGHDWHAWGDVSWDPKFIPEPKWQSYYAGQIKDQNFSDIALFFSRSKDAISSPVAREVLSGSAIKQEVLRLVTNDPQVPGMYSLVQAISADPSYRVVDIIPYSGNSAGDYVIWQRVKPQNSGTSKTKDRSLRGHS